MTNNVILCRNSLSQLNELYVSCGDELSRSEEVLNGLGSIEVPSNHPFNFIFPLGYGGACCLISSNDSVNEFLRKIHDSASNEKNGIINFLFGHKGDYIDHVGGKFIDRSGNTANIGMHRLFWGHDVFSIHGDNPFLLLSKQYGIISGILQVFRHLLADTFSRQGLPIPFHSYFDYKVLSNDGTEKIRNKLLDWSKNVASDALGKPANACEYNKTFSHLFTIKASDIGAAILNSSLCYIHNKVMKNDEATSSQVRIISYSSEFFGKAIYGAIKTGGAPFISWPIALLLLKEIYKFAKINISDITEIERKTVDICNKNRKIESEVFEFGRLLPSYNDALGYISEGIRVESGFNRMLTRFSQK